MHTIYAKDVDNALAQGINLLYNVGTTQDTRNGPAVVCPTPVATIYLSPRHRVLLNPVRDANPFFHLMESFWIIAGRSDVAFLSQFVKRMAEFSDDGKVFHAPYGHRLRYAQGFDQLSSVVAHLSRDKHNRQAVLQIWDATMDLDAQTKDKPCNDLIFCRTDRGVLDITVCNRSNDIIWGAYGANAVQFSVLQEYLAARIGIPMGEYTQFSFNYHAYESNAYWKQAREVIEHDPKAHWRNGYSYQGVQPTPLFTPHTVDAVEADIMVMLQVFDAYTGITPFGWIDRLLSVQWHSDLFDRFVVRYLAAYAEYKHGDLQAAMGLLRTINDATGFECDWAKAATIWIANRETTRAAA